MPPFLLFTTDQVGARTWILAHTPCTVTRAGQVSRRLFLLFHMIASLESDARILMSILILLLLLRRLALRSYAQLRLVHLFSH